MNLTTIKTAALSTFYKASFKVKQHSPEILLVSGIVGCVAGGVVACRATLKVNAIIEQKNEDVEKIRIAKEDGITEAGEEYTEEDAKKDLKTVYAQTVVKFVKLYAPAVAIETMGISCILVSHNIMHKRNLALNAAYATLDKSFKEYRKRVVDKYGKEVDKEMRYGVKATRGDGDAAEEGSNEEEPKTRNVTGYARVFEKYTEDEFGNTIPNANWKPKNEYNLSFLRGQQRYATDLLVIKGRVFLNEVYEALGFPRTKEGQVIGWVYDPNNEYGTSYIDFGIDDMDDDEMYYCLNDPRAEVFLDFNVTGNVWKDMT